MDLNNLKGTKIVEIPYFSNQLTDTTKSVLLIGEAHGGEGVSETVKALGFENVTTTDIIDIVQNSELSENRDSTWKHIQTDFVQFSEPEKYDYIVSVSVFEHFGLWSFRNRDGDSVLERDDVCHWNHDIRGMVKACSLLRDSESKLIITLPAGPYMNYEPNGDPFLRSYDAQRQNVVRATLNSIGCKIADEKFFFSEDFVNWMIVGRDSINDKSNYGFYNAHTPNVIWAFTVQKFV